MWGVWGGVAVEQLETQLTVTDLRRRIRNQSFNRIYIDQGVVECISPIQDNDNWKLTDLILAGPWRYPRDGGKGGSAREGSLSEGGF